jgi:hypothetical protein
MITRPRLKGPPSVVRVVFTFAMLSAITSILALLAVNPVEAMFIELKMPILYLLFIFLLISQNLIVLSVFMIDSLSEHQISHLIFGGKHEFLFGIDIVTVVVVGACIIKNPPYLHVTVIPFPPIWNVARIAQRQFQSGLLLSGG